MRLPHVGGGSDIRRRLAAEQLNAMGERLATIRERVVFFERKRGALLVTDRPRSFHGRAPTAAKQRTPPKQAAAIPASRS